jgi:ribosomal protein L31
MNSLFYFQATIKKHQIRINVCLQKIQITVFTRYSDFVNTQKKINKFQLKFNIFY